MMQTIWQAEPVLVAILGNGAVWLALFALASAFGHPVPDPQRDALVGLGTVIAATIARANVTPTAK